MNLTFSSSPCNKYNAVDFRTDNNNYKIGYIENTTRVPVGMNE